MTASAYASFGILVRFLLNKTLPALFFFCPFVGFPVLKKSTTLVVVEIVRGSLSRMVSQIIDGFYSHRWAYGARASKSVPLIGLTRLHIKIYIYIDVRKSTFKG